MDRAVDLAGPTAGRLGRRSAAPERRNHVGAISLLFAVAGAVICQVGLSVGPLVDTVWLRIVAAGFEAAMIGGIADWFAVTALFRHPLGLPIPHTALLVERRDRIIEGIVTMVQDVWLSPDVIGSRLARFAPSTLVVDWLAAPEHVERLGSPVRDLLRGLARMLSEAEVTEFVDRTIQRQLRDLPIDATAGRWLATATTSASAHAAFESLAVSLANLADRPRTASELHFWLDRSARTLRAEGKRLVPLVLRRKVVQRKIVDAVCSYASSELRSAAVQPEHPLRALVFGAVRSFADRLAQGDPVALERAVQLRDALAESLEAAPFVRDALTQLRRQLEADLEDADSYLSELVDRKLRAGILELLDDAERRRQFDDWVRTMSSSLLRRHHHQIGLTVRENLEALDATELVNQIEDRVGGDLQFIRLNGAVVGGAVGVLFALLHRFVLR